MTYKKCTCGKEILAPVTRLSQWFDAIRAASFGLFHEHAMHSHAFARRHVLPELSMSSLANPIMPGCILSYGSFSSDQWQSPSSFH